MDPIPTHRQESARGCRGASVHVQDDIPETETFYALTRRSWHDTSRTYPGPPNAFYCVSSDGHGATVCCSDGGP
jgi:hypothetical protein